MLTNPPTIPLEAIVWNECGEESDPAARMLAHVKIGSLDMHLEAWQIENIDDCQFATEASMRTGDFNELAGMMDSTFQTIEIDGRDYVLVATPYGR